MCLQGYFSYSAYALDCDNQLQMKNILAQVNLNYDSSALFSCVAHPREKQQTLIAYAVQQSLIEDIDDFKLYLLSVNHKTNQVKYFYPVAQSLTSDGIELYKIQWDLATYNINHATKAVGLRLTYNGRSRANPYSSEVLNLYDLEQKQQILHGLLVKLYESETNMRCNENTRERKSVLVMRPTKTYGYFDIQVRSQLEYYEMRGNEEHCIEINRKTSKQNFLLKFNGLRYVIPTSYKKDYQY